MTKKPNKSCTALNYTEQLLISGSTITGCILICAFASLVVNPIGIATSAVALKICEITAVNHKSATNKKRKNSIVS